MDATSLRKLLQRGATVWNKPTWNSLNTPAKLFLLFSLFQVLYGILKISDERKITNVARRKHTKQTIGSLIAWISTEFIYISLLCRLLREYPPNIVIFRYFTVYYVNIHRIYLYFVTFWKFAIFLYLVLSKFNRWITTNSNTNVCYFFWTRTKHK